MPAAEAQPQVHPPASALEALLTTLRGSRADIVHLVQVRTGGGIILSGHIVQVSPES